MTSLLTQISRMVLVASAATLVVHETQGALMDGVHGYWPLNEGSGTELRDFSNTQVPGVLRQTGGGAPRGLGPNSSVWVTDPIRGTVLGFTGNDADGYGLLG